MPNPLATPAPAAPAKEKVTFENDIIFHGAAAYFKTRAENPTLVNLDELRTHKPGQGPFIKKMADNYQISLDNARDTYEQLPKF